MKRLDGKDLGQRKCEVNERVPYGRMGRADDVTGMAVLLAMENACYIAVQCYNVERGHWMI